VDPFPGVPAVISPIPATAYNYHGLSCPADITKSSFQFSTSSTI